MNSTQFSVVAGTLRNIPPSIDNTELLHLFSRFRIHGASICYRPDHKGWGVVWFVDEENYANAKEFMKTGFLGDLSKITIKRSTPKELETLLSDTPKAANQAKLSHTAEDSSKTYIELDLENRTAQLIGVEIQGIYSFFYYMQLLIV